MPIRAQAYGPAQRPAARWRKPDDYLGPRGYFEFLLTMNKKGAHGDALGCKTINADAVGWLTAHTTGRSAPDSLSERIGSRLGTKREAFYTADSIGTPFAGSGFHATLRDIARLGQMLLDKGQAHDEQIVPPAAIASIGRGGKKETFAKADCKTLPGWSYRALWWISNDAHGANAARGVHGQTIWVDPEADLVTTHPRILPAAFNCARGDGLCRLAARRFQCLPAQGRLRVVCFPSDRPGEETGGRRRTRCLARSALLERKRTAGDFRQGFSQVVATQSAGSVGVELIRTQDLRHLRAAPECQRHMAQAGSSLKLNPRATAPAASARSPAAP